MKRRAETKKFHVTGTVTVVIDDIVEAEDEDSALEVAIEEADYATADVLDGDLEAAEVVEEDDE